MMNLKDKRALITGGTKGIGRAIAETLLQNEMNVMITGRSSQHLNELVEILEAQYPGQVAGCVADVIRLEDMQACVNSFHNKFGDIDILIANAGVGHFAPIDELDPEQWNEVIDVNLTGVYNSLKPTIPDLKKTQGYFISIASLAGTNFFAGGAAYNASKFGLVGFTQAVMLDLRKYNIKCTTLMPGSVSTHFNNNEPSDVDNWKIQPEDIAQIVVDLLKIPERTLPSKVEIRPTRPPQRS